MIWTKLEANDADIVYLYIIIYDASRKAARYDVFLAYMYVYMYMHMYIHVHTFLLLIVDIITLTCRNDGNRSSCNLCCHP